MVVVMAPDAAAEDIEAVIARVSTSGGEAFVSRPGPDRGTVARRPDQLGPLPQLCSPVP